MNQIGHGLSFYDAASGATGLARIQMRIGILRIYDRSGGVQKNNHGVIDEQTIVFKSSARRPDDVVGAGAQLHECR